MSLSRLSERDAALSEPLGLRLVPLTAIQPFTAPGDEHPSVCPHCWMVNPGPFCLCARCGASMETFLQESAGLRRTAAVQSPLPVTGRLSLLQRVMLGFFLLTMVLAYFVQLLPPHPAGGPESEPHAARR